MDVDVQRLPADVDSLKHLISELSDEYDQKLREQQNAYRVLEEKYLSLTRMIFGRSSEKLTEEDHRQMRLFNEAEEGSDEDGGDGEAPTVDVAAHERSKRGRKRAEEHLPRVDERHDVSEREKHCPCCGKQRPLIREEISEEKEIVPAKVFVRRHIRPVYGACSCKGFGESEAAAVVRAPMPERMLPGSDAGASLLAFVIASKFVDSLPFYRQEKIFARLGMTVARMTLCNWAIAVARRCAPLIDLMWEKVRAGPLQQMDETTIQVLKEPQRSPTAKSFMWVNLGYVAVENRLKPLVLFHYHPSRSKEVALSVLAGYDGYLQSDGYGAYAQAGSLPGIVHVGCFAHARRKFYEAAQLSKKAGAAEQALALIGSLYRIEKLLRGQLSQGTISREQFCTQRAEQAKAVLEKLYEWLVKKVDQVPPKTKLGQAVNYTLHEWPKLIHYLDAWFLTPDNNAAENAIRPFVVGRKNWLFSDTPRGAHASATLYSLVESARANGLEPYHYLRHLFDHLPNATTTAAIERLLPTNLSSADLAPT